MNDADHMMMPKPEVMLMHQREREAECIARQAGPLRS